MDSPEEIIKDIFLFKDFLNTDIKSAIKQRFLYLEDYLYIPKFKGKYPMNLKMICCGSHWSAVDNEYYDHRVDVDNYKTPEVPETFNNYAEQFSLKCFPYHIPKWDICLMNQYEGNTGTLGMHQDKSESKAAIEAGHPVISFSVGASCIFGLGKTRNIDKEIQLDDGDVLVFGSSARMIYHGVLKTLDNQPIRYNVTLRKF